MQLRFTARAFAPSSVSDFPSRLLGSPSFGGSPVCLGPWSIPREGVLLPTLFAGTLGLARSMDRDRHETILRGGDPATDHDPRVQHRERRRTMRRIHGMVWLLWIWLATRVDGNDLDRIRWERYACDGRERNASQTCVERDESLSRWMRRQMRSPRYAALSCYVDKSAAKHYATTQVPWLKAPETLAIYNNGTIPQLKRKEMPPSYALKSTHGSNLVMLVTNGYIYKGNAGRLYKNQFLTRRKITKIGMLFLRTCKQCRREVQYRNVQRAVLVEEFLGTGLPVAYKVHVMSGDVVALDLDYFVVTNSTTGHARNRVKRIVERDATALSAQFAHRGCSSLQQQPPVHAMELLFHAARQLASGFRYLRADFFWFNASWYFGELTLSPQAGVGRMDLWFGQKFLAKIGYCAQVMTNYP